MKSALSLVAAMHITASVFINDDESGSHEFIRNRIRLLDALPGSESDGGIHA